VPGERSLQAPELVRRLIVLLIVLSLVATAWLSRAEVLRLVPTPLIPLPPHDQYAAALVLAGLADSDAGRAWTAAAEQALEHPVEVAPVFSADDAFDAAPSSMRAWTFPVRRGQRVVIELDAPVDTLFLDLFMEEEGRGGSRVASAPPRSSRLDYIADEDGELVARLQPTLALTAPAPYRVAQRTEASLLFPVQGRDRRAVQSLFGAGRDSGRRRHEGIDIFAPRRTPVVAAVDGWITRQTTNRLGGNVVWLWAPSRGVSLYYAHLDEHAVTPGTRVAAGDVVGYVGNTGNARGTAPHLHFGVYAVGEGAVDPFPFVAVDPVMQRGAPKRGPRR
jgi:murein DD-endopeptidase MepM/ murein hydrolase activator NlpD